MRDTLLNVVATLAVLTALATPAHSAEFVVDTTTDAVDASPGDGTCNTGTGTCSLRAAVQEANALPGPDTIQLGAGTYTLTILGQGDDLAATGDLDITEEVSIVGASRDTTIVDGNATDRVLDIFQSALQVTISGLTLRNGTPGPAGYGGGMYNSSTLTLSNVAVTGNTAGVSGGGIENDSEITLVNCVVAGNTAASNGGGLDNALTMKLTGVTVSGNSASTGGGISNDFTLVVLNTTVSGNMATFSGGGIRNNVSASLANVTIADNTASTGSGLANLSDVAIKYTIVTSATPDMNCDNVSALTSGGHNLDSGSTCGFGAAGDLSGLDPMLGPLQNNGGSTPTHALLAGSPAIDAGSNDCPPPATDQRGAARPADGDGDSLVACDIGALEADAQCENSATIASALCRLNELSALVASAVPDEPLHTKLSTLVAKTIDLVNAAEQAATAGKKRGEKAALGKAVRTLVKTARRISKTKPTATVTPATLSDLLQRVNAIRDSLKSLRGTL